jgi:transketolase
MRTGSQSSSQPANISANEDRSMSYSLDLNERGTEFIAIDPETCPALPAPDAAALEFLDLNYRTLCAVMFNHASSGHPGGSVSSGRFVQSLLYNRMAYDISNPMDRCADIISYAAGHKALGLYAMWACRNEVVRQVHPGMLPEDVRQQLRLEDLLGFRKNPITKTPRFLEFNAKPLDGHPTPQTPFIWLSTGPSGVGVASSVGLALTLKDMHGTNAPAVHIIEGEGGMTPGRVAEALASAASSGLDNLYFHVDWNQAAIDSNRVTREGAQRGEYVQWDPCEFLLVHGFNVVYVPDGFDFAQIREAQGRALALNNGRPTAVVYRTIKGWQYGIEGCKSHGAGHKFYSEEYLAALKPFEDAFDLRFPRFETKKTPETTEQAYYDSLLTIRKAFESRPEQTGLLADWVLERKKRLAESPRPLRDHAPRLDKLYAKGAISPFERPESCTYEAGSAQTLRGALSHVFSHVNQLTHGGVLAAAADLYGSTSISGISAGFGSGFWHPTENPESRLFSAGGITEDAMGGICSGIATMGHQMAVGSSYGAFIAPLNTICAKTHGIGQQTLRHRAPGEPNRTFVVVCGHAGVKTGEDGPTHAEPHALQVLQENFPGDVMITLTPWDPNELWPLTAESLLQRPAVLAPFVTRPTEVVLDRAALGLAPPEAAVKGVYKLLDANGRPDATVVYQGSEVAYAFVNGVLPRLKERGINLDVYYIASTELFDRLDEEERKAIYPASAAASAMMFSGFTAATTYRWIMSERGRAYTFHPWRRGEFLGSGPGDICLEQAGMHGEAQWRIIEEFISRK